MILVTGGCGFIGSAFVLQWVREIKETLVNLDLLTYAGHRASLASVEDNEFYRFVMGDIADTSLIAELLEKHQPRAVIHFAAESHVDRSISAPVAFAQTNVVGTLKLLDASLAYWRSIGCRSDFRFLHVSTDEVFGSLSPDAPAFTELHRYEPNSPYSASKAASDHFVRAYHHTYGLPTLTTNCSNNYGPRQFPEKLIPLMILNALANKPLPVYGDGQQIRDWLHVDDHCSALRMVLQNGVPGDTYNIGGRSERSNMDVVKTICATLDAAQPRSDGQSYVSLVTHVTDRLGHDRRYAIDDSKISGNLNWLPAVAFEQGIKDTVHWYLDHPDWIRSVLSKQ